MQLPFGSWSSVAAKCGHRAITAPHSSDVTSFRKCDGGRYLVIVQDLERILQCNAAPEDHLGLPLSVIALADQEPEVLGNVYE